MLRLSKKWAPALLVQPETGMGYQMATVVLKDGRRYKRVTIIEGAHTEVSGESSVPFEEGEIAETRVTHER